MTVFEVIGGGDPPPPSHPQEAQKKKTGLNRVKGPLKISEKDLYSFPQLQGPKIKVSSGFLLKLKLVGIHCATQEMILS